jgi:E3 ubiquitin-protein ligase HECTD1
MKLLYMDCSFKVTILKHDRAGFLFESNRGIRHGHTAEIPLSDDFSIPWLTIDTLRSSSSQQSSTQSTSMIVNKTKTEQSKQRTTEIAYRIYNEYLTNISSIHLTSSILIELKTLAKDLVDVLSTDSSLNALTMVFKKLQEFIRDNPTLSVYELASSNLVDVLLTIFDGLTNRHVSLTPLNDVAYQRAILFCSIFLSNDQGQAFHILIRKLVSLMESIEKSPLYLYETSLNCGLQIFSKRFSFDIVYQNEQQLFIDRTGKSLNMEPLTTVGQLKAFLASMVRCLTREISRKKINIDMNNNSCSLLNIFNGSIRTVLLSLVTVRSILCLFILSLGVETMVRISILSIGFC